MKRNTGIVVLGLSALWLAPSALGAEEEAKKDQGPIEEIIVTSRRTSESQQDVPIAVTAFTAEDIQRIAPRTLRDLDGLAPNVRIGMNTAGPSAGAIFIRGIGYADIEKTQSPAVGVIIDGVQQGSNTGQLIDTFDVAQVEINRGPQGVLQGKNTTGGAIVVNRIRPEFNELGYALSAQGGNYDEMQFKGRVNIPLADDMLALKLGFITKERDGYYDNLTRGGDAGAVDYEAMTAALRWAPSDSFDALLTYDYIKDRGDIPPQDPRYNGDNPFKNEANFDEFQQYDVDSLTLNLNWELGFGTLTSVTGWQAADDRVGQDFDGSTRLVAAFPLVQLHTLREQEYEQLSEELKLAGDLNDSVRYVVGGFWWDTDLKFQQGTNQIVQLPSAVIGGIPCAFVPGWRNNPNPAIGGAFCQLPQAFTDHRAGEQVKSKAVFGSLTWDVSDRIEVSAGVRWLDEEKNFRTQFGLRKAPGGPVDILGEPISPPTEQLSVFPGFPVRNNESWDDTVFTLSGKWQIADANQVYASYSQGFRSGGFSIRGTDPSRLAFDPENVEAWEIGSKNDLFDGSLRLNLALFITKLEDSQFSSILTIPTPPGTNTLILNGSEPYNSKGIEAEAIWAVTEEFSLIATLGMQDTEGDGDSHSCLVRPYNTSGTPCNPTDNPALFAPGAGPLPDVVIKGGRQGFASADYNAALAASWDREINGNELHLGVIARRTDEVYLSAHTNGDPIFQPAYTLLDAQVSYQINMASGDKLRIAFYGKNLTDEEYVEQELLLGEQGGFKGWGPPATYALEVQYEH